MFSKRKRQETEPERRKPDDLPKFLGYGLPRAKNDRSSQVFAGEGFTFHDEPLRANASFLDFDGVVLFAGTYDKVQQGWMGDPSVGCADPTDLDLREREFYTAGGSGKTLIFLVPAVNNIAGVHEVDSRVDLFRRVVSGLGIYWEKQGASHPAAGSLIPEFKDFISRFGTAYVAFRLTNEDMQVAVPICRTSDRSFGFVVGSRLFFLPCAYPQSHAQAVEMATLAVAAAVAYRQRMSKAMPDWVAGFSFTREAELRQKAAALRHEITVLEAGIDGYGVFKGALAYQSETLVKCVREIFERFFEIKLEGDDKCIEDAVLRSPSGDIAAVFEIKGVKGSFTRANVNQIDSHRERLGVPTDTPGVLIMNTVMDAASLDQKDQASHPDIIKKAVSDQVLLIRTLDLLRYANLNEAVTLTTDGFRTTLLRDAGWLKVTETAAEIVTK